MRLYTQQELVDELVERFGANPADWSFTCPNCGDAATAGELRDALAKSPRLRRGEPVTASDILGQECIGRHLGALQTTDEDWARQVKAGDTGARGCTWVAYGLIGGPDYLAAADGRRVPMFRVTEAVSV